MKNSEGYPDPTAGKAMTSHEVDAHHLPCTGTGKDYGSR